MSVFGRIGIIQNSAGKLMHFGQRGFGLITNYYIHGPGHPGAVGCNCKSYDKKKFRLRFLSTSAMSVGLLRSREAGREERVTRDRLKKL